MLLPWGTREKNLRKEILGNGGEKMKKVLVIALAFSLVLGIASLLYAVSETVPGIQETPHDVRVMTGETTAEPCAMCHTPHSGTGDYPLWNRDQGAQTYQMYDSPSFDMGTAGSQPQAPSSLCLVCHNGVYSTLVNYPGPGSHQNENYDFEMNPTFWAMLGTDLTNDHPISFTYNPALDTDLNGFPLGNTQCTGGNPNRLCIAPGSPNTIGFIGYPLYGANHDQFECATCHSVHDTVLYSGKLLVGGKSVGTQVFFLRHDNSGSQMCAACHRNRMGDTGGHGAGYETPN